MFKDTFHQEASTDGKCEPREAEKTGWQIINYS